jgi:hypothetical protein
MELMSFISGTCAVTASTADPWTFFQMVAAVVLLVADFVTTDIVNYSVLRMWGESGVTRA